MPNAEVTAVLSENRPRPQQKKGGTLRWHHALGRRDPLSKKSVSCPGCIQGVFSQTIEEHLHRLRIEALGLGLHVLRIDLCAKSMASSGRAPKQRRVKPITGSFPAGHGRP